MSYLVCGPWCARMNSLGEIGKCPQIPLIESIMCPKSATQLLASSPFVHYLRHSCFIISLHHACIVSCFLAPMSQSICLAENLAGRRQVRLKLSELSARIKRERILKLYFDAGLTAFHLMRRTGEMHLYHSFIVIILVSTVWRECRFRSLWHDICVS